MGQFSEFEKKRLDGICWWLTISVGKQLSTETILVKQTKKFNNHSRGLNLTQGSRHVATADPTTATPPTQSLSLSFLFRPPNHPVASSTVPVPPLPPSPAPQSRRPPRSPVAFASRVPPLLLSCDSFTIPVWRSGPFRGAGRLWSDYRDKLI